ncbi:MAG: DUF6636 domain-containing protein [Aliihoeflea sp.]
MWRLVLFGILMMPTAVAADGYGFMTPTGNIYCNGAVEVSEISCTIVERSGPPTRPKPGSCAGIWGHTFSLAATGEAILSCENVPPRRVDYSDIATYGVTAEFGDITCRSESNGLTCQNKSGHGFSLSRRNQKLF